MTTRFRPTFQGILGRIAGQSAMLFSGFAIAQACSFLRNAIIGHALAPHDFGIAASITMTLQLCETLSDLGADRLIVQAEDGEDPALMASAHTLLIARGAVTALALYLLAQPMTGLFRIPDARWAFELIAAVPLLKSLTHLDMRRRQRHLENLPFLLTEVLPQILVLAAALPVIWLTRNYAAVVWLALAQAVSATLISHAVAQRRYGIGFDFDHLQRLWRFGWPIWLSAIPLVAVYQGDRIIVGSLGGMEALATYTAAFMMTMVPGLLAAKVGHALMLPLLSEARPDAKQFITRVTTLGAITAGASLLYLMVFAGIGGLLVRLAFGSAYAGLDALILALAGMWALRMIQAVPGMALLSVGTTRPLLVAGIIRATALGPAYVAAATGYGAIGVAVVGIAGELASLVYVVWAMGRVTPANLAACLAIRFTPMAHARQSH
ncbi:MAG: oligosaccharide flippase family protein [Hyphomicrobiaceae bacterium]|nr:oligosaccharide flippase family protein [Hyphomicrobiaceae bacterium]